MTRKNRCGFESNSGFLFLFCFVGQLPAVGPVGNFLLRGVAAKAFSILPVSAAGHLGQQLAAFAHRGGSRGAERNYRLAAKIIALYKAIDRPGGNAPSNGVAN